ncbi:hypothetical protein AB0J86_00765 [Micromonospora sp. NPDC049559]|uniref:hypothetical protein n=1 Tax=Micromonospora sp. NPDC049559 TaxID=3155923 RepID=UPI00343D5238
MKFLERYLRGEHEQVWADLRGLGPDVRDETYLADGRSVAEETMRRVRNNVEVLRTRLDNAGYRFKEPDRAHLPPPPDIAVQLDKFERQHGPLPLSLRAFYQIVGTVTFIQSSEQFANWYDRDQRPEPVTPVAYLGEYDPLVVEPLACAQAEWNTEHGKRSWFLAPDECHKANYSGGMNYNVLLPEAGADFRIYGMIINEESHFGDWFVGYLRETFRGGGFRGKVDVRDDSVVGRLIPDLEITHRLAEGLQPIGDPNEQTRLLER